ncbi:hypothetical protein K443DRAFT_9285 [Laccaria amethystina LaAM-08-1]|uniref:MaoC-like domain-containing protein n=1 Tax=Laccaria amethystina LaAM-08-1 TaxID=1095629 RepID=A0A0C9XQM4_9AGAR|nr:hypothetical protein K443DRAFT_9285 [Laccaria amethystina LaAM-08-1]
MSSAKGAGSDIIKLLDSAPEIDAESDAGKKADPNSCKGHIRLEGGTENAAGDPPSIEYAAVVSWWENSGDSWGNPVLTHLQRRGPVPKVSWCLSLTMTAPSRMQVAAQHLLLLPPTSAYLKISGDFSPIHINPYFSNFASLPAAATHGFQSSIAIRRCVDNMDAKGRQDHAIVQV